MKTRKILLLVIFAIASGLISSCQEENVNPHFDHPVKSPRDASSGLATGR